MDFYREIGELVLGSWLKRISNQFQMDILKIYTSLGIRFDLSWFPVFYLLNKEKEITITSLAKELKVSHPAIIQVVNSLKKEKLVRVSVDKNDKRKRNVKFTEKGFELMRKVEPVWVDIQKIMDEILTEGEQTNQLLPALGELEDIFTKQGIYERFQNLNHDKI
ncbi:MAG: MarR family winged helix-turn-helix transcriptional regulator [Bacteroidales bacterium]|nr:MarR family winged helix-turn-helix transcriptional regulator [Bacteroidales bacterium]